MTTLTKIGIGAGIIAALIVAFPSLRGPINRVRNSTNEKLEAEFVVDNYKAKYIELNDKLIEIEKAIQKFECEKRVTEKKLSTSKQRFDIAKNNLLTTGTSDLNKFNQMKDVFETTRTEMTNLVSMINTYSNAITKLVQSRDVVLINMHKAKTNVTMLESKKMLVDSIKTVNSTVADLNCVGDMNLAMNIEKLDDDMIREEVKLEALHTDVIPDMDKDAAEAYIQSLK